MQIGSCQFRVLSNPKSFDLNEWILNYHELSATGANLIQNIDNTTMSGMLAKKITIFDFDHNNIAVVTIKNNNVYYFSYQETKNNPNYSSDQQRSQEVCEKIISTFRFANNLNERIFRLRR